MGTRLFGALLVYTALLNTAWAAEGLMGGQGPAPYSALVKQDGSVKKLKGLPPTGLTFRVAMNSSGEGLVGGTTGIDAYAGRVNSKGRLKQVNGLIAPGEIYTVAINRSSHGIIGGGHQTSNTPYAALISPNGHTTTIAGLPGNGLVYSVAIDSSREGIIGGKGPAGSAYAARVSSNGTLTPLTGLPSTGAIFWVSANDSKEKFIGGQDGSSVYAAFVDADGSVNPIANLPPGLNYSVAINSKGQAIMGGSSLNLPFAARVKRDGTVLVLEGLPDSTGIIYNVAMNDAGTGLIAGFSEDVPFGAFVAPNGSLTRLKGLPAGPGFLDGIAIHPTGIALVGGKSDGSPFAAFAAPNGHLTYLSGLPQTGEINSIAISTLSLLVPKSIGPFSSYANVQFTLANALTQHGLIHRKKCLCSEGLGTVWASLIGNKIREKAHHSIPSYTNKIGGILVGYDYTGIADMLLGAGMAYAFNDVHARNHAGNAEINHEAAVVYASVCKPCFSLNTALWGGVLQGTHKRRTPFKEISSKGRLSGWTLTPHFDLSFAMPFTLLAMEPFVSLDWANSWQNSFKEHGSSGFNIALKKQYVSLLRTEIGLRFFQTYEYCWGNIALEERGSYVNRTHCRKGTRRARFIGSDSTFGIETCNSRSQNLGLAQVHVEYRPSCLGSCYAGIDYQGEFGASFYSHMLTLECGKTF